MPINRCRNTQSRRIPVIPRNSSVFVLVQSICKNLEGLTVASAAGVSAQVPAAAAKAGVGGRAIAGELIIRHRAFRDKDPIFIMENDPLRAVGLVIDWVGAAVRFVNAVPWIIDRRVIPDRHKCPTAEFNTGLRGSAADCISERFDRIAGIRVNIARDYGEPIRQPQLRTNAHGPFSLRVQSEAFRNIFPNSLQSIAGCIGNTDAESSGGCRSYVGLHL